MIRVDNVGAIFMAGNVTAMSHNKHVDVRYKYANKDLDDVMVKIVFAKSTENYSNILTKNLGRDPHEKHTKKMIDEKPKQLPRLGSV